MAKPIKSWISLSDDPGFNKILQPSFLPLGIYAVKITFNHKQKLKTSLTRTGKPISCEPCIALAWIRPDSVNTGGIKMAAV